MATSTFQTGSPHTYDNIQGLREQIIANASVLFPQVTAMKEPSTAQARPFEVIITRENSASRALLLHTEGCGKKIAAKGPAVSISDSSSGSSGGEAEQALRGLLNVTSEALGWYTTTLLGEVENSEEVAGGGEVDFLMVETGFHFAAVERCMEGK